MDGRSPGFKHQPEVGRFFSWGGGNDEGNICQVQWSCCFSKNLFVDKPLGDVSRPLGSHADCSSFTKNF